MLGVADPHHNAYLYSALYPLYIWKQIFSKGRFGLRKPLPKYIMPMVFDKLLFQNFQVFGWIWQLGAAMDGQCQWCGPLFYNLHRYVLWSGRTGS